LTSKKRRLAKAFPAKITKAFDCYEMPFLVNLVFLVVKKYF